MMVLSSFLSAGFILRQSHGVFQTGFALRLWVAQAHLDLSLLLPQPRPMPHPTFNRTALTTGFGSILIMMPCSFFPGNASSQ